MGRRFESLVLLLVRIRFAGHERVKRYGRFSVRTFTGVDS